MHPLIDFNVLSKIPWLDLQYLLVHMKVWILGFPSQNLCVLSLLPQFFWSHGRLETGAAAEVMLHSWTQTHLTSCALSKQWETWQWHRVLHFFLLILAQRKCFWPLLPQEGWDAGVWQSCEHDSRAIESVGEVQYPHCPCPFALVLWGSCIPSLQRHWQGISGLTLYHFWRDNSLGCWRASEETGAAVRCFCRSKVQLWQHWIWNVSKQIKQGGLALRASLWLATEISYERL